MEESRDLDDKARQQRSFLKEEFRKKTQQEEIKYKQRSLIKWLEEGDRNTTIQKKKGDRNTKFFHGIVSACMHVNCGTAIMARDQVWAKKVGLEREIVSFYEKLYTGTQRVRPRLDDINFKTPSPQKALLLESHF